MSLGLFRPHSSLKNALIILSFTLWAVSLSKSRILLDLDKGSFTNSVNTSNEILERTDFAAQNGIGHTEGL